MASRSLSGKLSFSIQAQRARVAGLAGSVDKISRRIMGDYPKVLVVTMQSVSLAHGIGAVLLRHFDQYDPAQLANVFILNGGQPPWAASLKAQPRGYDRWSVPWAAFLAWRLAHKCCRVLGLNVTGVVRRYQRVSPALKAMGFIPDVIYSNCYCSSDSLLTSEIVKDFKRKIPLVQHFHDYMPDGSAEDYRILRKLLPLCDAVWALDGGIAEELKARFGCSAEVVSTFKAVVGPRFKLEHRAADPSFRAVMVGNVYYLAVLEDVRSLWRYAQARIPGLGPIEWIGHPIQVERCEKAKVEFKPEVKYVGFKERLHESLVEADLAIVPLNPGATPENSYTRFSIPSRLTELAMAGLPIYCIAGPGTATRRFVEERQMGVCANASEGGAFFQRFWELLGDRALRARLGSRARQIAETEFDLKDYRTQLYTRLRDLAARRGLPRGRNDCRR